MAAARSWAILVAGIPVAFALSAVALYLYIKSAEARRWDEMRAWSEQAAREVRARDYRRPVLRGQAVQGNAWDDYNAALASIAPKGGLQAAADYLFGAPKADPAKARALVQANAPALQTLRRGTTRSFARQDTDWENPPRLLSNQPGQVAILAMCQARFLFEDGHAREALETLLDVGQLGADRGLNGAYFDGLISVNILWQVQDELKRCLDSSALSREDCGEMARELEALDRNFPREGDAHAIDPMTWGFLFLKTDDINDLLKTWGTNKTIKPTWRFGFSERLMLVDAFEMETRRSRRLTEAADRPWKEARDVENQLRDERRTTKNPLIAILYEYMDDSGPVKRNSFRDCRARLRLLWGAAQFRATGLIPYMTDPYAEKMGSSLSETHLKLWSVGGDGIDDGGNGEWNPRKGKDIVLEMRR